LGDQINLHRVPVQTVTGLFPLDENLASPTYSRQPANRFIFNEIRGAAAVQKIIRDLL
jgi:hypothetical protein